ncbi:hypothetical protein B9479_002433 [Cryptococcus floricola]|uniref:Uncharacterized protein n=1 Tax=Cryptococcus floricola TaxID=2591691 RepID=A0A5D3B3V9_9TREE|nr:hypothetical protein B9479_002433 [Cryptococcus floricola]
MSTHTQRTWIEKEPYKYTLERASETLDDLSVLNDDDPLFEETVPAKIETTSLILSASTYFVETRTLSRETLTVGRQFPDDPDVDYEANTEAADKMDKEITNSLSQIDHNGWIDSCFGEDSAEGLKKEELSVYSTILAENDKEFGGVQLLQITPEQMRAVMATQG